MPRPKKTTYAWYAPRQCYRKQLKDADGKYFSVYAKTVEEMGVKVAAAEAEVAVGLDRKASPTVKDYAEKWISLNAPGMKYKYRESTVSALRVHVIPVIGDMRVAEVKPDDAQRVMAAMAGRSKSLHDKVRQSMRKVFEAAKRNHLIAENPCDGMHSSGKKAKPKRALTDKQAAVLLNAVAGTNAETFVRLALYAGLRREEALGLKWDCVYLDADTPHLQVRRAVSWEHGRPIMTEELKSEAAYRIIPIPPQLTDHLRAKREERRNGVPYKRRTKAELKKAAAQPEPKEETQARAKKLLAGYVLGGENPLTEAQWRNLWRYVTARQVGEATYRKSRTETPEKVTFVRELGAKSRGSNYCYTIDFDVTPHELRHTYCTNLILGGAKLKRVQYLMGHEDPKVTIEIYTHLMDLSPVELMNDIKKVFKIQV